MTVPALGSLLAVIGTTDDSYCATMPTMVTSWLALAERLRAGGVRCYSVVLSGLTALCSSTSWGVVFTAVLPGVGRDSEPQGARLLLPAVLLQSGVSHLEVVPLPVPSLSSCPRPAVKGAVAFGSFHSLLRGGSQSWHVAAP